MSVQWIRNGLIEKWVASAVGLSLVALRLTGAGVSASIYAKVFARMGLVLEKQEEEYRVLDPFHGQLPEIGTIASLTPLGSSVP